MGSGSLYIPFRVQYIDRLSRTDCPFHNGYALQSPQGYIDEKYHALDSKSASRGGNGVLTQPSTYEADGKEFSDNQHIRNLDYDLPLNTPKDSEGTRTHDTTKCTYCGKIKKEVWEGHRYGLQALKPAGEIIIVFQKPYEGKPVDDITRTGAGSLNIDGGRIGSETIEIHGDGNVWVQAGRDGQPANHKVRTGRWPANFIIQHSESCVQVGTSPDGYTINRFTDGAKPFGDAVGEKFEGEQIGGESAVWQCVDGCPARELDRQSGDSPSSARPKSRGKKYDSILNANVYGKFQPIGHNSMHADSGGAARFFFNADYAYENLENAAPFYYQAKAGKRERNAGLAAANIHPTLKPISLIKHLATLLLPPSEYTPRRILIPFAGTGSEMIGAFQAGWECIIGIEKEAEYIEIAKARIDYWEKQGIQLDLFEEAA